MSDIVSCLPACCVLCAAGTADLPRPTMAGPVGGAVVPTAQGFDAAKWNTGVQQCVELRIMAKLLIAGQCPADSA